MLTLADLDAAIAAADTRRSRRIRHADLDHEAEIAPLLKARRPLVEAARAAEALSADTGLTYAEIACVRPAGKVATSRAVKAVVYRALKRERVVPGVRDGLPTFPRDWLRRNSIIA